MHNDGSCNITGATNTDATHYRIVQSSSGCATPWAGKAGTGANFVYTGGNNVFLLAETYARARDLYLQVTGNAAAACSAIYSQTNKTKILNCVTKCTNAGSGAGYGVFIAFGTEILAYNCIAYECKSSGIYLSTLTGSNFAVCCTSINNGTYGFNSNYTFGTAVVWSCYGADNPSGAFLDNASYWDAPSGWNAADDATADLGGTAGDNYKNSIDLVGGGELDGDYLPTEHISWSGGAGDNAGRNPYNDFTGVSGDFDDFFKNDTAGEAISKKDVRGYDRNDPDTADTAWDVGAAEYYVPPIGSNQPLIVVICG